jgi:hypothetical protein
VGNKNIYHDYIYMTLHLPSDKFYALQNIPQLTVPTSGAGDPPATPCQTMAIDQVNKQAKHGRTFTSPEGYPVVMLDSEGLTKEVIKDPYYQGTITKRSGVLGQGTPWFKKAERNGMWRSQHGLPDMRYVASFASPSQADPSNYKPAPPVPFESKAQMKAGSRYINGVSYIPRGKIIQEQPAVVLFSNDPRVVTLDQVESDLRTPQHNTVANSLAYTSLSNRSPASVRAVDNHLLRSRKTWNHNERMRMIRQRGEYGEAIPGMSWADKVVNNPIRPIDVAGHHQKIRDRGIVNGMSKGDMMNVVRSSIVNQLGIR